MDTTGIRPGQKKVQAIKDMATPSFMENVRRISGMINYVARFVPNITEISAPLRKLLVKDKDRC